MNRVAIYRHQLFLRSEPFITQQAGALRRFEPVYVGRSAAARPVGLSNTTTITTGGRLARARHALWRDSRSLVRQVRTLDPVLVHAHFGVEGVYAMGLCRQLDLPLITTFHGFDATMTRQALLTSRKVSWLHYVLSRHELAARGDLFICVSDYIRGHVLGLGFPEDRTVTHYIGIDTQAIAPANTEPRSRTILHVARLVEKKGTRYLIAAFARIARTLHDAQLVIIGEGPLRQELQSQAEATGVSERIHFLGGQPNRVVLERVRSAAIMCLPSVTAGSGDGEGLGMVILEGAAAGLPIVTTRHGGIPEVIEDGVHGYLTEERNDEQLAARLSRLLTHEDERIAMGMAARANVRSKFDVHSQTRKLEDLYENVLTRRAVDQGRNRMRVES
ncbi:MAG: glycosyltransferase [Pseudomonadota bacterium]